MTKEELYDLRDHGEVTKVQFKERIIDTYDVGCELVAFSNYHGGQLVQGYRVGENGAVSGILRAMEDKPNVTFENRESAHEFVITIKREPAIDDQVGDQAVNQVANQVNNQVSNQVANQKMHQEMHQETHQESNQEMHQETHQESNQEMHQETHHETHQESNRVNRQKPRLTKEQQDIVNFCSVPRSAKEILDRKGLYNQSRARKKYIQPLGEMGVLEMTIPENPNDRNQKYRKKK